MSPAFPEEVRLRHLVFSDQGFLEEMFYHSLYFPEEEARPPKTIIHNPGLVKYHFKWGYRKDDHGLLASWEDQPIGAVWCRLLVGEERGYGYVNEETPELGIAIKKKFRNHGLGTILIREFLVLLKKEGYKTVSLSVDQRNKALNLYRRMGFAEHASDGNSMTMLRSL